MPGFDKVGDLDDPRMSDETLHTSRQPQHRRHSVVPGILSRRCSVPLDAHSSDSIRQPQPGVPASLNHDDALHRDADPKHTRSSDLSASRRARWLANACPGAARGPGESAVVVSALDPNFVGLQWAD